MRQLWSAPKVQGRSSHSKLSFFDRTIHAEAIFLRMKQENCTYPFTLTGTPRPWRGGILISDACVMANIMISCAIAVLTTRRGRKPFARS